MTLQPNFCDAPTCGQHIGPDEPVVQIIWRTDVDTEQEGTVPVEGPTEVFHERHAPDPGTRGREVYRGPLGGIRRNAT